MKQECEHIANVDLAKPANTKGCEECLKSGDSWVHLRICLTCGHVGCCDSSNWAWCYVDEAFLDHPHPAHH
jgi:hypothetical protein